MSNKDGRCRNNQRLYTFGGYCYRKMVHDRLRLQERVVTKIGGYESVYKTEQSLSDRVRTKKVKCY